MDAGEQAEVVHEEDVSDLGCRYGEATSRVIYMRFATPGIHKIVFEHVRPWSGASLDEIEIEIDGHGKELEGFARRKKRHALRRAA